MLKSENLRLTHEQSSMRDKIKDNKEKIKVNKQIPWLVSNVVEVRILLFFFFFDYFRSVRNILIYI